MRRGLRLGLVATAVAVVAALPAAAADEPVAIRGPASGAVLPAASTIVLEADTNWFCTTCSGAKRFLVASDPEMTQIVSTQSGSCPPDVVSSCPDWAVAGPLPPGTYYWRADARFGDGSTHQTDVWTFTVTPTGDGKSTFTDGARDAGGAPDITAAHVTQAGGRIRIVADIPGLKRLAPDQNFLLGLDTDQNGKTGAFYFGAEYLFVLSSDGGTPAFSSWEDNHWVDAGTPSTSISYGSGGGAIVATFDRFAIGGGRTTGFNFWFETIKGDPAAANSSLEFAPDASVWNIQLARLAPAASTIRTVAVRATPPAPAAASTFRVQVPSVTLSDGRHVTPGSVTCRGLLAGRPLQASRPCTFRIPATGAGKRLSIRVSATYAGAVSTRTLTYVVRRAG